MQLQDLVGEVAQIMADVLVHQRTRWGVMLGHQRQYEGWWKAEMALALESWAWRADLPGDQEFGVLPEAKPRDFGHGEARSAADLLVAPWDSRTKRVIPSAKPRVWVELKIRGTWWGAAAKAFGPSNDGLHADLVKWEGLSSADEAVLICQVTHHDGTEQEQLPPDWKAELDTIGSAHPSAATRVVGFEIPGKADAIRWARFDSFLLSDRSREGGANRVP